MSEANAQCACDIHSPRINPFADQYGSFFSIVDSGTLAGAFAGSGGSLAGEAGHGSSSSSGPGSRSKISQ